MRTRYEARDVETDNEKNIHVCRSVEAVVLTQTLHCLRNYDQVIQARSGDGYEVVNWERDVGLSPGASTIRSIYRTVKKEARSKIQT